MADSPMQPLHPLSVIFGVGLAAKRLLLPGLIVLLFRPGGQTEIWLMVLFVPAVIGALAKYLSFRYRLGDEELVVREGIVTRNERHIPYTRIQNIDLVQNPFHRWFGVAEVRVETASGERPEAVMRVLSMSAVESMRASVFRGKTQGSTSPDAETESEARVAPPELVRVTPRDLVLLGLTSHRGIAVIAAAMGLFWQINPLRDFDESWFRERVSGVDAEVLAVPGPVVTAALITIAALVLFVVLTLLSITWATVKFYGFTLSVHGDDLRAEYGLFTRITATIPRHRIQLLSTRAGPVHRWFGRTSIQVETAGHGRGDEGPGAERLWLAPMIETKRAEELLHRLRPDVEPASLEWKPIALRAWRRIIKRGLFLALVLSVAAGAALGWWAAIVLLAGTLLAWAHARLYVRHARYAMAPESVVYRSGWWTRRMSVVPYGKIQALALDQSPFDRWNRMACLRVDTAGAGQVGHGVFIRYLEADVAWGMMDRLAHETGARPYRW